MSSINSNYRSIQDANSFVIKLKKNIEFDDREDIKKTIFRLELPNRLPRSRGNYIQENLPDLNFFLNTKKASSSIHHLKLSEIPYLTNLSDTIIIKKNDSKTIKSSSSFSSFNTNTNCSSKFNIESLISNSKKSAYSPQLPYKILTSSNPTQMANLNYEINPSISIYIPNARNNIPTKSDNLPKKFQSIAAYHTIIQQNNFNQILDNTNMLKQYGLSSKIFTNSQSPFIQFVNLK